MGYCLLIHVATLYFLLPHYCVDPLFTVLPDTALSMDQQHYFEALASLGAVSHVRMSIYPDGGVSRLRLFSKVGS